MKLRDCCSFIDYRGKTPEKSDFGYRFITAKNVGIDGFHDEPMEFIPKENYESVMVRGIPNEGDILFTTEAPMGHVGMIPHFEEPFAVGQRLIVIQPNKELLDAKYLMYLLRSREFQDKVTGRSSGSTVTGIRSKELVELDISFPGIDIQRSISITLELLGKSINKRIEELSLLDELIKARFVELFEDGESPLKTIEELCSEIVDCPHTTPKYEGDLKNPAIRTSEIKKGYITWDSMKYVSDEEYEERVSRLRPEAGDIVYGREGTFGNAAVLPEGYKFCLGQRVMLLRPDYTKCTSEYLLHAVISDDVYRQAFGKNNASTVAHVNVKDVKQFKVPLPSFDKQNQFADFVKQTDKSKVVVQKALDEAQVLFDSLMQDYFG